MSQLPPDFDYGNPAAPDPDLYDPDAPPPPPPPTLWQDLTATPARCALLSAIGAGLIGAALMAVSANVFKAYGIALFCLSPLICGFASTLFFGITHPRAATGGWWQTSLAVVAALATLVTFALLIIGQLEGLICVAMASPIALGMAVVGTLLGRGALNLLQPNRSRLQVLATVVLLYPAAQLAETRLPADHAPITVETTRVTAVPPARLWRTLTQPVAYPAQVGLLFRAGVAYPTRTALVGCAHSDSAACPAGFEVAYSQGVSTLPIRVWRPGRQLTFGVPQMPAPMRELSPYPHVHAPHLHGYFRVVEGTFLLEPLPGGRTRLTARTTYVHTIGPRFYWQWWSNAILDQMHGRVLEGLVAGAR